MSSIIKLKRGNEAAIKAVVLETGEPAISLDTHKLFVGDGTSSGGFEINAIEAQQAEMLSRVRCAVEGIPLQSVDIDYTYVNNKLSEMTITDNSGSVFDMSGTAALSYDGWKLSSIVYTLPVLAKVVTIDYTWSGWTITNRSVTIT